MDKQKLLEQLFSLSLEESVGITGVRNPVRLKCILNHLGYENESIHDNPRKSFIVYTQGFYHVYNNLGKNHLTYDEVVGYYENKGAVSAEPLDVVGLFSKGFKIVDIPRDKHDELHTLMGALRYNCDLNDAPDSDLAKQWYVSYQDIYHAKLYPGIAVKIHEQVKASELLACTFVKVHKGSLCQTVSLLDSLGFKILGNVRGLLYIQPNRPNVQFVLDLKDLIRLYTEV